MIFRITIQLSSSHRQQVFHFQNDQLPFDFISQSVEPAIVRYHRNSKTFHNSGHNTQERVVLLSPD